MNKIVACNVAIPQPGRVASRAVREAAAARTSSTATSGTSCEPLGITPCEPAADAHVSAPRLSRRDRPAADARRSAGVPGRARRPTKREELIDALLERPEYADYWANKWADLLRPNPYRVGIKPTMTFDAWIRDAFRAEQAVRPVRPRAAHGPGQHLAQRRRHAVPRPPRAGRNHDARQPAVPRHPAGMCQVPSPSVRGLGPGRLLQLRRVLRPRRRTRATASRRRSPAARRSCSPPRAGR